MSEPSKLGEVIRMPERGADPPRGRVSGDEATRRASEAWERFTRLLEAGNGPSGAVPLRESGVRALVPPTVASKLDGWKPEHGSVLLTGPSGTGKTMAALLLAMRLFRESKGSLDLVWHQSSTLALARQRLRLGDGEAREVERSIEARVLVLDDVGWERDPAVLADVLAARYAAARPTLSTSGYPFSVLSEKLGEAVARRLLHCGRGHGLSLSLRGKP